MSDRSYCVFQYLKVDEPLIFKACPEFEEYPDQVDEENGIVSVHFSDESGGGSHMADQLTAAGLTFLNDYCGCPGAYDPGLQGSFFGDYFDVIKTDASGWIAVTMDMETGEPHKESLDAARRAILIKRKISKYFAGEIDDIKHDVAQAVLFGKSRFIHTNDGDVSI